MTIRRDGDSRELNTGDAGVTLESLRENDESVLKLILSQTVSHVYCRQLSSTVVLYYSDALTTVFTFVVQIIAEE